ncbi:hypothetical protein Emed_000195 [Eimeria media]
MRCTDTSGNTNADAAAAAAAVAAPAVAAEWYLKTLKKPAHRDSNGNSSNDKRRRCCCCCCCCLQPLQQQQQQQQQQKSLLQLRDVSHFLDLKQQQQQNNYFCCCMHALVICSSSCSGTGSSSSSSSNSNSSSSDSSNCSGHRSTGSTLRLREPICCGTSSSDSSNGCSSSNSSSGNSSSSNSSDSSSSGTEADSLGQQSCLAARSVEAFSTSSSSSNGCSSSSSNSSSNSSNIDTNSSSSSSNGGSKEACGKERVAPGSSSRSSSSSSSSTACERPSSISSSSLSRCSSAFEIDEMIQGFYSNPPVLLSEPELWSVCQRVKELLLEESNVQPVPAPVVVCGDIHGQLQDLLLLLHVAGSIPSTRYVFLGDYVDRGRNSVETFELLMLLKLRHPSRITLLRGNHESRQITTVYGFYDECLRKYGNANAWRFCCEVFDYLTLAALIEGSILCVHGGLSPDVHLLDQLQLIHRVREIPTEGAFGDLVWSDPDESSPSGAHPTTVTDAAMLLLSCDSILNCKDNSLSSLTRHRLQTQMLPSGHRYPTFFKKGGPPGGPLFPQTREGAPNAEVGGPPSDA